jgi:hypothetical protein
MAREREKAMAKKPKLGALTVRLDDRTWKVLEADMKAGQLSSLNAAIQRRLNRTLIDDMVMDVINKAAFKAALEIQPMVLATVVDQLDKLESRIDSRFLNLHELISKGR